MTMALEFVMMVVGFFAATGFPLESTICMPSMQKSNFTHSTPSIARSCWTASIVQDAAPAGCSNTKNLPRRCCSKHISSANCTCFMASRSFSRTMFSSSFG